jgi:hypothetical protein
MLALAWEPGPPAELQRRVWRLWRGPSRLRDELLSQLQGPRLDYHSVRLGMAATLGLRGLALREAPVF